MTKIKSTCKECGNVKYLDEIHLGKIYKCKKCFKPVKVEKTPEIEEAEKITDSKNQTISNEEMLDSSKKETSSDNILKKTSASIAAESSKKKKSIYLLLPVVLIIFIFVVRYFRVTNSSDELNSSNVSTTEISKNENKNETSVENTNTTDIGSNNSSPAEIDTISDIKNSIIVNLFTAENENDIEKAFTYYSDNILRYYDMVNPRFEKIKNRINHLCSVSYNRRVLLKQIEKISENVYLAKFDFEYYGTKQHTYHFLKDQMVYFEFDENNRVIKEYDKL